MKEQTFFKSMSFASFQSVGMSTNLLGYLFFHTVR